MVVGEYFLQTHWKPVTRELLNLSIFCTLCLPFNQKIQLITYKTMSQMSLGNNSVHNIQQNWTIDYHSSAPNSFRTDFNTNKNRQMINRVHYKNHKSSIIVHGHDQTTMNIWPSWGIFTVIPPNQTFEKVNMKIYSNFHKPCTTTRLFKR